MSTPPNTSTRWFIEGMVKTFVVLPAAPAFGIPGAEHQPRHARVDDGRGAHDTGLERHIKSGAIEAIGTQGLSAGAQRFDFGVGGGIVAGDRPVCGHREDRVALHQNRAHRHLARGFGAARGLERQAHEIDVIAATANRYGWKSLVI